VLTASYVLLRSRPFQNWAMQKVVKTLSQELKTKVTLKSIDFELINNLVLEGLYVEDQQGDTLVYFGKLRVNFNYKIVFDNKLQLARIKRASLENTKIYLLRHPKQSDFNYQFIVDYFDQPSSSKGKFVPFKLIINELELKNVDFRFRNMDEPKVSGRRFDESFMEYRGIIANFKPFKLIGDSLNFDLSKMSFIEKSGFRVNEFSAKTIISSTIMQFDDLILKTPFSKVSNFLSFSYKNYNQLGDFVDSVYWNANLETSVVGVKDIAYFSDALRSYSFPITIKGKAQGTLASMEGSDMEIKVARLNNFKGHVFLKDLTDSDKLSFEVDATELYINPSSIQDISQTSLPEELLRIGSLKYSGTVTGKLDDITSKGLIETTIGKIRTDLNLKFPEGKTEEYKGEIELYSLNSGKLLNRAELGYVSLVTKFDGKGFNIKDLNTKMLATVSRFDYDGYSYQNIKLDGTFEKKLFNGEFEIKDPNVNISLSGMFDLNKTKPIGDFQGELGAVNLKTLGYGDINIKQVTGLKIEFEGDDIDEIDISTQLNNVVLEKSDTVYYLGDVILKAYGPSKNRFISLESELGNVNINGEFKISHLNAITENVMYDLFPNYYANLRKKKEPIDIRFDVDIADSKFIKGLFISEIAFKNASMTGVYSSYTQTMDVKSRADFFSYLNFKVENLDITSVKQPGERLSLNTKVGGFYVKDSLITDKLGLIADIGGNDINYRLNVADTTHDLSLETGGNIKLSKGAIDFEFRNSTLFLYNKPWVFNEINHFKWVNSNLQIDSFKISNGLQLIEMDGLVGTKNFENFHLNISNFYLQEVNPILMKWGLKLDGFMNGQISLNGLNTGPVIVSSIFIDNLSVNGDSVGDVTLNTTSEDGPYSMAVNGNITNGLINDLKLAGNVDLTPGKGTIDISLLLNETNIKPFEVFTEGLFSKVDGIADAVIKIKGSLTNPDIKGKIEVNKASLFMDYLGIALKVDKMAIDIDEKRIDLGTFQIADKYGSLANGGGKIFHKNFNKLRLDIFLKDLKNFNAMDLAEGSNDLFFGLAFVDGNMTIKGPIDQIYLNINAKTRAKTIISLPLAGTSENVGPDYIKVVDLRADVSNLKSEKLSGISMDFNCEVTKDAEIDLIFDAKFNDVIRATGSGNITMELNTAGDFYMYGKYVISTGNYNFTALNTLINKNLKVREGGTITWRGNPLEANLDLVATTVIKANPSVILPSSSLTSGNMSGNVDVDCQIFMKDNLFSPQIKLGIDLSKDNQSTLFANTDLVTAINQIKADPEETNKQFINLIVFNSFAPLNSGNSTASASNLGSTFQNSIGSLITSQVNNWLSQMDPNWDFGIDYKAANSSSDANQQVMVSLKRKLYNDRIEIGTSYGQSGNTNYDVNVSYKIRKDGRLLVRAFNKKANDPRIINTSTINTSGLGLYYRNEVDYFFPKLRDLNYQWKLKKRSKAKASN